MNYTPRPEQAYLDILPLRSIHHWSANLLVVGANFTGYLLPWDQLAYWGITVGTNILTYVPLVGSTLSRLPLEGSGLAALGLIGWALLRLRRLPVI